MANITTALLDFLMDLLKSPQAGADFVADPDTALQNAGLQGICAADVDAVLPVALDFGPVGNREYDTGGNSIGGNATSGITGGSASNAGGGAGWGGGGSSSSGGGGGGHGGGGHGGGHGGGGHGADFAVAKAKLVSVVNNYSYIDDRDVVNDLSVNQNIGIVAGDDVTFGQIFGQESTTVTGDGNIVAGGSVAVGNTEYNLDVEIDDSFNEETEIEIEDSFNDNSDNSTNTVIEVEVEDSFNDDHSTEVDIEDSFNDNSTEIEDSFNEETEIDVEIEDSFNEDNSVEFEESFNEDNSVDNSVEFEESFNDNSTEVEVEDSFNEDSYNETEVEVEIEDSFNDDSFNDEVEIEESFNDNVVVVVEDPVLLPVADEAPAS